MDQLNWCDETELSNHSHLFEPLTARCFQTYNRKKISFSRFFSDSYFNNILPVIASSNPVAERLVCCRASRQGSSRIPCDRWTCCPICAWSRAKESWERYQAAYDRSPFFHLTLGYDGDLAFNTCSAAACQAFWDTNLAVLKLLLEEGYILGAYLVHELKIRELKTLRANPHSHAMIAADGMSEELLQTIPAMIAQRTLSLTPSLKCIQISSKETFRRQVCYLTKAIDLHGTYTSAWNRHGCETERCEAQTINRNFREALDGIQSVFDRYTRVHRLGNLSSRSKSFIGERAASTGKRSKKKSRKRRPEDHHPQPPAPKLKKQFYADE